MDNTNQYQIPFFFIILAAIFVVVFMMFQPFLNTLIFAATLAVVLWPLDQAFERMTRGNTGLSALLSVLVAILVIIGPLSLLGFQIFNESRGLYNTLSNGSGFMEDIRSRVEEPLQVLLPQFDIDVTSYVRDAFAYITSNVGAFFSATLQTILGLVIGLLSLYFFLKDGPRLKTKIKDYSPLTDRADELILDRVAKTMSSVMKGSLLIALIQGTVAGIGFFIFGVPNATLWGSITAIASLIPGLGTSLIMIPVVMYLFIVGEPWQAGGLLLWAAVVVGLIDNVIRPYLVSKDVGIHSFLIFLSVLGGIGFFGPLGFLIGPIVLSLFFALLDVYQSVILKIRKG